MAERKNKRRTRAHLLRQIDKFIQSPFIRQYKHYLADRMIAEAKRQRANQSEG